MPAPDPGRGSSQQSWHSAPSPALTQATGCFCLCQLSCGAGHREGISHLSGGPQGLHTLWSQSPCSTARAVGLKCGSPGCGDRVGLVPAQWALLVVMLVSSQGLTWRKAEKEARGWASVHAGSWRPSPTTCSHGWTGMPGAEVLWDGAGGWLRGDMAAAPQGWGWGLVWGWGLGTGPSLGTCRDRRRSWNGVEGRAFSWKPPSAWPT